MKKTAVIICSLVLAFVLAAATVITFATPNEKNSIGSQKALEIALKDAGVSAESAREAKSVFTKKNRKQVFDVEFEFGKNDYDYLIDAETGEILSRDIDTDSDDKPEKVSTTAPSTTAATETRATVPSTTVPATSAAPVNSTTERRTEPKSTAAPSTAPASEPVATTTAAPTTTKKPAPTFITAAKAKEIALKDAGIKKSQALFTKAKLDKDDGIYEYEIEFYVGLTEYDYSINAKTGAIIEKDIDRPKSQEKKTTAAQTTKPAEQSAAFISIDKAKQIALSHAGLDANDVHFEKVKLEKDDGIYEYEVEFTSGRIEYEYSINAKSGSIIDFEIDRDD